MLWAVGWPSRRPSGREKSRRDACSTPLNLVAGNKGSNLACSLGLWRRGLSPVHPGSLLRRVSVTECLGSAPSSRLARGQNSCAILPPLFTAPKIRKELGNRRQTDPLSELLHQIGLRNAATQRDPRVDMIGNSPDPEGRAMEFFWRCLREKRELPGGHPRRTKTEIALWWKRRRAEGGRTTIGPWKRDTTPAGVDVG